MRTMMLMIYQAKLNNKIHNSRKSIIKIQNRNKFRQRRKRTMMRMMKLSIILVHTIQLNMLIFRSPKKSKTYLIISIDTSPKK